MPVKPMTVAAALLAAAALSLPSAMGSAQSAAGARSAATGVKNVVLVHGAFADGSSWSKIVPLLEAKGLNVTAVQNPLTSLDDDVAATKRAIDAQPGRVLLVGHSWAGAVISQIGDDPKVAGLVFVAAGAPDAGQSFSEMGKNYPAPAGIKQLKVDASGFASLPRAAVVKYFAPDLPHGEADVIAATQGPIATKCFDAKITAAAWKTKPTWYVVAARDQMIQPSLERALAKKMKATTIELPTSHVPMLAQPRAVAAFIASAAARAHI
jgi:pimeloyl-ACP methyl ester carboxylesterase